MDQCAAGASSRSQDTWIWAASARIGITPAPVHGGDAAPSRRSARRDGHDGPSAVHADQGDRRWVGKARSCRCESLVAEPGWWAGQRWSGRSQWGSWSRRGNRRLNHAIHMAAVTQISHRHSDGRAYYERKLAEGKTPKDALRSLKRRGARAAPAPPGAHADPGRGKAHAAGAPEGMGEDSVASAGGSHPHHPLFGPATPPPATTL